MPKLEAVVTLTLSDIANRESVKFGDLEEVVAQVPLRPFDTAVIDFLSEFSRQLLRSAQAKKLPDVVSLAYWCRPSNLERMRKEFGEISTCIGRGIVFHVPPTNVPLNFAYSLLAGLLSGNSNIVRMSSIDSIEVAEVLNALRHISELSSLKETAKRICIVQYGHDDEVTEALSLTSDARVIWGGDNTVRHIRGLSTKPRSVDISFADRVSISLIRASAVLVLSDDELTNALSRFYVDGYTFNQNACSSPRLVVWHGNDQDVSEASHRFWTHLDEIASRRGEVEAVHVMNRFVEACETLVANDNISRIDGLSTAALKVSLRDANRWEEVASLRFGTFTQARVSELSQLEVLLDEKVQTIGHLGFSPSEFEKPELIGICRKVDRIVPLGEALSFELTWDGYDLIRYLSRHVVIR